MSKLLITGVTGLIGARLADLARAEGYEVVGTGQTNTDWETARLARLESSGIDVVGGSILDASLMETLCQSADYVIHLAAAQHEAGVPDDYFRSINIDGTRLLLEVAEQSGVKRFVHGSTIGVYGAADGVVLDENSPLRPDNIYGTTKLEAERLVLGHAGEMETTAGRISETYGPGDGRLLKLFKAIDSGRFLMIGKGANLHQLIFVDDLARGLLRMACHPQAAGEVFVLAGQEAISTEAMVAAIAAALGRKPRRAKLPLLPFALAASMLDTAGRRFGFSPPLTPRRLDFFRKSFRFGTEKARTALDFSASVGFDEGARITADWYRQNGRL